MSPQYSLNPAYSPDQSRLALTKARKMLENHEDARFRNLDRALARAYIELRKQRIQQKRTGFFVPRMDLCDDPSNPHIIAMLEVPGMKPEQLSVRIENGRLIIQGERTGPHLHTPNATTTSAAPTTTTETTRMTSSRAPSEPSAEASMDLVSADSIATLYPVRELKYGKFRREIVLPAGVIATHVRSTLVEGMLTISWPRDPSAVSPDSADV